MTSVSGVSPKCTGLIGARGFIRTKRPRKRHKFFGADEVGLAKQDAIGEADLLLRLVKGIELQRRMLSVDDGNDGVERVVCGDVVVDEERLRDRCRVGEPGGLDDDAVERLGLCLAAPTQLDKDTHQVTANGAADAAVVHLDNLFGAAVNDQIVVDALFAELILDDGDALAVAFAQDAVEQRGLASTEKAGENCDRNLRRCGGSREGRHFSTCPGPVTPRAKRRATSCSLEVIPFSIMIRSAASSHCS